MVSHPGAVHRRCPGWDNGAVSLAQSSSSGAFFCLSWAAIRPLVSDPGWHPPGCTRGQIGGIFHYMACLSPSSQRVESASRTGWFQAQPKPPTQILCVHQEGFGHSLIRAHLPLWLPPEEAEHRLWAGHRPQCSHGDNRCPEDASFDGTRKTP